MPTGRLAWDLPQDLINASGSATTWSVTVAMTDSRVEPPTSFTATGSVVVGYGRPSGQPPITVQGNLYTLVFDPRDTSSQPIANGQALLLRYWPDGADIANNPNLIQRRIVSKGPDGKYQWDSLGLDPNTSYTYYYDVYASLDLARAGDPTASLNRSSGHFKPQNASNAGQESRWVISGVNNKQVTVHRSQTHNAFGEVVSETDGNGNTTNLQYNTEGNLTAKIDPQVTVTYGNGYQTRVSPQTSYIYDRLGQLVGTRDANGNLSTQRWNDALGKVSTEFHADHGVVVYQYDALGDQRVKVEALDIGSVGAASARRTDSTYDKGDRLVRVDRPAINGQRAYDVYVYDELDRRVSHNSLLGTDTVDYDVEGNVSRVVSAAGRTTTYTTVWNAGLNGGQGAWVKTTTLPYNLNSTYAEDKVVRTLVDQSDSFGRALAHTNLAGTTTGFLYYSNGLLKQQGSTVYTYYNNGLMRTMTDSSTGIAGRYEYDNNGNKTFEGFTGQNGQWAFQQSVSTYDELNRLVKVVDPRYTISYEYDAMGNRMHMNSVYVDGLGIPGQTQDYWYAYDTMNRFTTTMGQLKDGRRGSNATDATAYVWRGASGDGVTIGYDAFNERVSATYASDGHNEAYAYDNQGYLTTTTITNSSGARTGKATRVNDLSGRVTDYAEYGATDATVIRSLTHTWDADSLLVQDRDNVKTTQSTTVGTRTERLADGTVKATQTFGEATTVRTTYDYVWFDSAKQSRIQVQASNQSAPGWAPGLSTFNYDSQGRLVSAYDVAGSRGFKYQLDGEGHILQRDELLGGTYNASNNTVTGATANRMHSYFYLDGQQIGNVGNDGPERIDYAQELARNAAANANRDDAHQRFAPVAFADFDSNYQPINSQFPGSAPGSYVVQSGDTLTGIALALWGDSSLWWMLADANNLTLDTPLLANSVLTVPNKVTNIHNNSATFRPYDAGKAIGNTQPTLPDAPPPPPAPGKKGGCGGVLQVVAIAVAVAATFYTAGVAAGAGWGFTSALSAGSTALAGGSIGAAAIGGAVGSIAGQSVLIAGGEQSGFNWKGVAMGAIGAAVTAGIGQLSPGGIPLSARINTAVGGGVPGSAAQAAVRSAVTDALGSVTGAQAFSWKDVAASAVSAGASYGSGLLTKNWDPTVRQAVSVASSGVASATVRGNLSQSWNAIAQDVVASTIGNSIVEQISSRNATQSGYQFDFTKGGQGVGAQGGDLADSDGFYARMAEAVSSGPSVVASDWQTVYNTFGTVRPSLVGVAATQGESGVYNIPMSGAAASNGTYNLLPGATLTESQYQVLDQAYIDRPDQGNWYFWVGVDGHVNTQGDEVNGAVNQTGWSVHPSAEDMAAAGDGNFMDGLYSDLRSDYFAVNQISARLSHWIGGKVQSGEQMVDQARADLTVWSAQKGGMIGGFFGREVSDYLGRSEGALLSAYKQASGVLSLSEGMRSLVNPVAWAFDASGSVDRLESIGRSGDALYLALNPSVNSQLSLTAGKMLLNGLTEDYQKDWVAGDPSKMVGRIGGDIGGALLGGGPAVSRVGKAVEVLDDVARVGSRVEGVPAAKVEVSDLTSPGRSRLGWPGTGGSGPVPGVIAINDETSVAALQNYYPKGGGIEFVFDPETNTFATGKPVGGIFDGSPHQQLARSIGASEDSVVGGTLKRSSDGGFATTEHSGHYGQNWNDANRQQFQSWLTGRVNRPVNQQFWPGQ
jgi:YD repeat-containing protein